MSVGRVPARLVASIVLAVGLFGMWAAASLLVTIGCAFEGTCSIRENGVVVALAAGCVGVFGYATWRIWRH